MATSLAPKPRNPPVLIWMLLTEPSGPVLTRCTVPTLLPSDEITAKRISGLASRGAAADLPVAPGWAAAGGAGSGSGRAAGGGALGEGGLSAWLCAAAGSNGAPARTTQAPTRRTNLRCDMARSPSHWTCSTTVLERPGSSSRSGNLGRCQEFFVLNPSTISIGSICPHHLFAIIRPVLCLMHGVAAALLVETASLTCARRVPQAGTWGERPLDGPFGRGAKLP